jgi:hypothetical protein
MAEPEARRSYEVDDAASPTVAGFVAPMAAILGDVAAMELLKFYGAIPQWNAGSLIEINLLSSAMTARRVLRVPRCPACSPLNTIASVNLEGRAPGAVRFAE